MADIGKASYVPQIGHISARLSNYAAAVNAKSVQGKKGRFALAQLWKIDQHPLHLSFGKEVPLDVHWCSLELLIAPCNTHDYLPFIEKHVSPLLDASVELPKENTEVWNTQMM